MTRREKWCMAGGVLLGWGTWALLALYVTRRLVERRSR